MENVSVPKSGKCVKRVISNRGQGIDNDRLDDPIINLNCV